MLSRLVQPTAIRLVGRYGLNSLNKYQQIRYNTTKVPSASVATPIEPTKTVETISDGIIKWEDIPKQVPDMEPFEPFISGAVIPLSQLNIIQNIFFPFTLGAMYYMDYLLNYMPWWGAIVGTTVTFRLLYFPVMLILNKQGARTYNILPKTIKLQTEMNDAMINRDTYKMAMAKSKLDKLNYDNRLTMKHRLVPLLSQAPMYASIFMLLRSLTGVQAEGLTTGGALWFTNLTLPDPYFILPLITCSSMFVLLEFGLESGMAPPSGAMKLFFRAIPVGMFVFIHNFPAATLLFWTTSNMFTLFYAFLFKQPWIKKKLGIPDRLKHNPEDLKTPDLLKQLRRINEKEKPLKTTMEIRRLDQIAFKKTTVDPLRKQS